MRLIGQLAVSWLCNAIVLAVVAWILTGVHGGTTGQLLAAAVGLYELSRTECPQLADANVKLQEAIATLASANAKSSDLANKDLRTFLLEQAAEITGLAVARSCAPRPLNLRLIDDRRKQGSPAALTQIVLDRS